jgi:pimeloyl-ACP methyl ester carboxylesterase
MSASFDQAIRPAQCPTVVLLHSSASSSRQWESLVETLKPRFRLRAIDLHGHGRQADWHGDLPLTLADEAALVAPLLAQAGGAHVVGHSFGAAVALKLATMHPRLVRSLVAYEPVMFRWWIDEDARGREAQDIIAVADSIRDRLAKGDEHSAAQRFIDFWSGAGVWESLPGGKKDSIATRMRAVHHHFDALFHEPLQRAQLALLRVPMLFMTGAQTVAVMRRLAELLRHALPHARHDVLQGMGHMGPITHAADVNRRIVDFLHAHAPSRLSFEPMSELA